MNEDSKKRILGERRFFTQLFFSPTKNQRIKEETKQTVHQKNKNKIAGRATFYFLDSQTHTIHKIKKNGKKLQGVGFHIRTNVNTRQCWFRLR